MSESNPFEIEPVQVDLLRPTDFLAECRRSHRAAVQRITVKEFAFDLNLSPGTVENQQRFWSRRKKPSADAAYLALKRDEQHAREVVGQCGWILNRPPRSSPEDSLRQLAERAASRGYVSSEEVARAMAQTDFKKGGR